MKEVVFELFGRLVEIRRELATTTVRLRNKSRGVIIPPKLAVLSGAVEQRVRDVRNAIEHLDSQLACGDWREADPLCLMVYEDRLELAGHHIRYAELAHWVKDLHELAVATAQFKDT